MISAIIPVFNEKEFISRAINSILKQDISNTNYEILIVDGMSTDGTREVIKVYQSKNKNIFLIKNPNKIVSIGFNKALSISKGKIIIRLDGHAEFRPDYFRKCLTLLNNKDICCVGGVILHKSQGSIGESIKIAQSSNFGTGGVNFRKNIIRARYVNTLAFGAYKREVFEKYGGYDEELIKNQDDEFNLRLVQNGNKIWLDPSMKTIYYSRDSFKKLFIQYFYYGFYKVRVIQKRSGFSSWRHLIPGIFVFGLFISIFYKLIYKDSMIFDVVILLYLIANIFSMFYEIIKKHRIFNILKKINLLLYVPLAFWIMHLSYGFGFILGAIYFRNHWKKRNIIDIHFKKNNKEK